MDNATFLALALACAPQVHPTTAQALVSVESGFNPYAIGVVGGALVRQPRTRAEALATIDTLRAAGWNYSVGLGQINVANFARLGLTPATALDPCTSLTAMQAVLAECYLRALPKAESQTALRRALSCYYSGNFVTGMRHGYVGRVVASARSLAARPAPAPTTQESAS
ncbi:lytic transglycosylase domain-containing protein [Methylibium petroleiphilum]|jgi:type IV secretion system protein VirB1|uniref:lytic transglycosylase domain-containing protein n=1 Tax=Methylibium petroleiphilum TaxID=105560 RepID=UPI003D2803F7